MIFRQTRVGRGGEMFVMLKFRSMVVDAEARKQDLEHLNEGHGALFKMTGDPRVTPLGRSAGVLLDELPQLFNVLGGSMSLVGPRPILEEIAKMPGGRPLPLVTPGLTGLWQISGRSNLGGRGLHPPRPALRRELVAGPRPAHHAEDRLGRTGPARSSERRVRVLSEVVVKDSP